MCVCVCANICLFFCILGCLGLGWRPVFFQFVVMFIHWFAFVVFRFNDALHRLEFQLAIISA